MLSGGERMMLSATQLLLRSCGVVCIDARACNSDGGGSVCGALASAFTGSIVIIAARDIKVSQHHRCPS